MPFPWKKNRVTRISRIVADLQSPKRGGSLVVETGFPTSLIDLFVKNRNRFQKTSRSKKPVRTENLDPPPPPPPPSPATSPPPVPIVLQRASPPIGENRDDAVKSDRVSECGFGSGLNAVVVVAKMLMVVVLVASVKRITVGITVSAFALLFLEYASKRVVSCKGHFSDSTNALKSLSQRVSSCVWYHIERESETGGVELSFNSVSVDEIEVVEVKSEVEISCELLEDDSAKENVVELCHCEVTESKIRVSRSDRLKSKMVKKLMPKKFRASKKKDNKASAVEEDKPPPSFEIEEIEDEIDNGISKLECIRDDEVIHRITYSRESSSLGKSNQKKMDRFENGNSGYIILLIIALTGLLLGRFQALILLTTWCFMLKMGKILWRSQNVPLIKCSVSNS